MIALTGETGGDLAPVADVAIRVPSTVTAHIQECHLAIEQLLASLVEDAPATPAPELGPGASRLDHLEHLFDTGAPPFGPTDGGDGGAAEPIQTTLELGVPLSEVTFCVVDLETTGGSPAGLASPRSARCCTGAASASARSSRWSNPGQPIPPFIAHLTGIDDWLVSARAADRAGPAGVLRVRSRRRVRGPQRAVRLLVPERAPAAAATIPAAGPPVCTAKLARRVVWPDVPNVRSTRSPSISGRARSRPTGRSPTPRPARRCCTGCSTWADGSGS